MDIITLGFVNDIDKEVVKNTFLQNFGIQIVWDFEKHNIECIKGVQLFKEYFKIKTIGVLLDAEEVDTFSSYPLIYEISEYYLSKHKVPKLFNLIDNLKLKGMNESFFSFSDSWDEKTLVRVKEMTFDKMKQFLDNIYVWCETYTDLINNEDIRISDYPLVIRIEKEN